MKRIYDANKIIGTSRKGSIEIAFDELVRAFGEPVRLEDSKVQAQWIFQIGSIIITIYDYKSSVDPEENTLWSIGGNNHYCPRYVKEALDSVNSFYLRVSEESFRGGRLTEIK